MTRVNCEKKAGLNSNRASGDSSTNFASTASLSSWSKAETVFALDGPDYPSQLHEGSQQNHNPELNKNTQQNNQN